MRSKTLGFDLLLIQHQRAAHEFWLFRTRGYQLSEDTRKFIDEHPEFIFDQFDKEFEEDPFQRQLGNPRNFFCPDSRHSPSNQTPPPTPPSSASSDEESEQEEDSTSTKIPPKKNSKKGSSVRLPSKSNSNSNLEKEKEPVSSQSRPTKTNSSIQSISDSILHSDSEPIDFHKNRTGEIILYRRDPDIEPSFEPEFDPYEEELQKMSTSKSPDDYESSSSSEGENPKSVDNTDSPSRRGNLPETEPPEVQLGFNGLPLEENQAKHSVFVSNSVKVRLDGTQPPNHDLVKKFVSQVKNNDFKVPIEKLIDGLSWLQIMIIARGMSHNSNSISEVSRLKELDDLETYVTREKGQIVELDNNMWNETTICRLLLECYPAKQGSTNSNDTFTTRCSQILPKFDLTDPKWEREFVHKVGTLLQDMGDTVITEENHLLVISIWVRMWPPAVLTRWKSFCLEKDVKTIKKFLQIFANFLQDGRRASTCRSLLDQFRGTVAVTTSDVDALATQQAIQATLRRQLNATKDFRDIEYAMSLSVKKAMKEHGESARIVIRAELKQMIDKGVWHPVDLRGLTKEQRKRIIRSTMFIKEKYSSAGHFEKLKARIVSGGDQQDKQLYDNLSAPTVATSSVFAVAAIAAAERRHGIVLDIGGAYLNAPMDSGIIMCALIPL
jgi:hypothetical protein